MGVNKTVVTQCISENCTLAMKCWMGRKNAIQNRGGFIIHSCWLVNQLVHIICSFNTVDSISRWSLIQNVIKIKITQRYNGMFSHPSTFHHVNDFFRDILSWQKDVCRYMTLNIWYHLVVSQPIWPRCFRTYDRLSYQHAWSLLHKYIPCPLRR